MMYLKMSLTLLALFLLVMGASIGHYIFGSISIHPFLDICHPDFEVIACPWKGHDFIPAYAPPTHEPKVSFSPQISTNTSSSTVGSSTPPFWSRRRAATWTLRRTMTS
jgi:hypothetical protein